MLKTLYFFTQIKVPEFLLKYFKDKFDPESIIENLVEEIKAQNFNESHEIPNVIINKNVHIGKDCKISPFTVIDENVWIGDNVEIGPNAHIRSGSMIGNNCVIGHAAEIKNSILMDEVKSQNHTFLGDSIAGFKSRIGGHSETANRKFDQSQIAYKFEDMTFQTSLDKLGMILGEESRLGGGVFTAPGTVIGSKTFIETAASISGFIPSNKFVKNRSNLEIVDNKFNGNLK